MTRAFKFSPNEYYHLYNRGTEKREVFLDGADYRRFISLLYACNASKVIHLSDRQGSTLTEILGVERGVPLVDIGVYCLMPNHFHLLVRERREGGISLFVQKLSTAYTMYFNKRYKRSGSLFQGRFKATHVNSDEYLKYLFAYIHLNPVKLIQKDWKERGVRNRAKVEVFLCGYRHSSYRDYVGETTQEGAILTRSAFPDYFSTKKVFKNFIDDWLNYRSAYVKVQP